MQDYRCVNKCKKQLKWYKLMVFTLFPISVLLLFTLIATVSVSGKNHFCFTTSCLQTATRFQLELEQLNCHKNDFSSCKIPSKRNGSKNKELLKANINSLIVDYFDKPIEFGDTSSTKMVKNFYKACTNEEVQDDVGLETIFKYLNQVGLPRLPSILMHIDNDEFDLMKVSADSKKLLGIDLFFGLKTIDQFEKSVILTTNISFTNGLYYPRLVYNTLLHDYKNNTMRDNIKATTIKIFKEILNMENVPIDNIKINKACDAIFNITALYGQHVRLMGLHKKSSLQKLSILDKTKDVHIYLKLILKGVQTSTQTQKKIDVYYFGKEFDLINYLLRLPKVELELFSWWKIVSTLIGSTGKLENKNFGDMRTANCYNLTMEFLSIPFLSGVIDGKFLHKSKVTIYDMMLNIKHVFYKLISSRKNVPILFNTKYVNMLKNIKLKMVAPSWITNRTRVSEVYQDVRVSSSNHIDNIVSLIRFDSLYKLNLMFNSVPVVEEWPKVTDVSIQYDSNANTLNIPLAVLRPPIFNLGVSSLEYGALGSTIANELWMHFRGYVVQDDIAKFLPVDNNYFIEEKISEQTFEDQISIYIALEAYKIFLQKHSREDILPGFQDFSNEEMFFLGTLFKM